MTKDEFIDGYMARSKLDPALRTADGFKLKDDTHPGRVAVPCACGNDGCPGWSMIRNDPETIADHFELYHPDGPNQSGA